MFKQIVKGYPIGSDITIMNTWREFGRKQPDGKYSKDAITIVYKDNKTGLKDFQRIEDLEYEFYAINDDVAVDPDTFTNNIDIDKTHPVICKFKDLELTIAKLTNNEEQYWTNIKSGRRSENRRLHINNCIFQSDQNIEDHYRYQFNKQYTNNIGVLSKGYIDIETDGINAVTDFPSPEDSPINAVTYIDMANLQCYTFLLRDPDNPKMLEFEQSIGPELFTELKDFVRDKVGGWKQAKRFGIDELQYNFLVYDEEIVMLHELFKVINTTRPDFVVAWNMAFDIPFIIERVKYLGYKPEDILCDQSFDKKVCEYYIDERNIMYPEERGDYAKISSTVTFLDQLIHFRSRRKGQQKFPAYKLDDIGYYIAKVRKYDYHHICDHISKLPRADYKAFVFYNIMDVIVQICIENKVQDLEYVYGKSLIQCTRHHKVHRQTTYLTNRRIKSFNSYGKICCNNPNAFNAKPLEKYIGAFVAPPELLADLYKMKINGTPVDIIDNANDFDYKALYPSTIRENNIADDTMIGQIIISGVDGYNRGGDFIEDLQCHHFLEFGTRWLNLANYSDLIQDIKEFMSMNRCLGVSDIYYDENNLFRFKNPGFVVHDKAPEIRIQGFNQYNSEMRRTGFVRFKPYDFEEATKHLKEYGGIY